MRIIGFSGTQNGTTPAQGAKLDRALARLRQLGAEELHHGDCIGADAEANRLARALGLRTVSHPPANPKKRAHCEVDETRPPKDYLARNSDIAAVADVVVATPKESEEAHWSGTWSTVRRARARKRPLILIWPDGRIDLERWPLPRPARAREAVAA